MACGAGKLGDWLTPDEPLGVQLRATCELHDALYGAPGGRSRSDCDALWLIAMLQAAQHGTRTRRRWGYRVALAYFFAVRLCGWWPWLKCRAAWRASGPRERALALATARANMVTLGLICENEPYETGDRTRWDWWPCVWGLTLVAAAAGLLINLLGCTVNVNLLPRYYGAERLADGRAAQPTAASQPARGDEGAE